LGHAVFDQNFFWINLLFILHFDEFSCIVQCCVVCCSLFLSLLESVLYLFINGCVCVNVAGASFGDDEKLTSHYFGHVSHGSQQERVLLQTAGSIEGSLFVLLSTATAAFLFL